MLSCQNRRFEIEKKKTLYPRCTFGIRYVNAVIIFQRGWFLQSAFTISQRIPSEAAKDEIHHRNMASEQ